jgi:hypothetical protein
MAKLGFGINRTGGKDVYDLKIISETFDDCLNKIGVSAMFKESNPRK